ncbi:caspase-3-like [Trematomus bernacchii]|uniref:caspase-3-like n=1 Tax=Trematomus bernacchii TaxID=40690 RepID=UPI00146DB810|nr:caspase-3-like [Trematomus bernacchii]XP_033971307.1 caspase-3-like [Trematomus bernacchii]
MAAYDILRRNKTSIVDTLCADHPRILIKAQENELITPREYTNLKSNDKLDVEVRVVALVDKIMDKGEDRCQAFLNLLQTDKDIQETYPKLKNILEKENCLLPHPVQASSVENIDNQPESRKEDEQYELKSQPTGLCLIINNKTFPGDGKKIPENVRYGTDKDAESLAEVFSWLGFRVLMCKDQTKDQMERALKCFASQCDLSQLQEFKVQEWTRSGFTKLLEAPQHGDAFICCVLSHGRQGVVLGVDKLPLPIKQIKRIFMATRQSPLTAKPKVFLIQACQGGQVHPMVVSDDLQADDSDSTSIPQEADILVHCSTVEDYFSMRHPVEGSWFIQSVCKQLKDGCDGKEEIDPILRRVNNEVAGKQTVVKHGPTTQMAEITNTLRKRLVLTPRN